MMLADMIREKSQKLHIPIGEAPEEHLDQDELDWKKAKDSLYQYGANIEQQFQDFLEEKKPYSILTSGRCEAEKCGKDLTRTEFTIEPPPNRTVLIVYECPEHNMRNAEYVALNNKRSAVHIRPILKNGNAV